MLQNLLPPTPPPPKVMPCVSHCYLFLVHKILTFYIEGVLKFKCPNSSPQHVIFYSPVRPFASLMDFSQSTLFLDLTVQSKILYLPISVCTQFHHLFFFGRNIILHMAKSTRNTQLCCITLRCYFLMVVTNGHASSFPRRSHHHHHHHHDYHHYHHHHHHHRDYNWFKQSSISTFFCLCESLRIEDCQYRLPETAYRPISKAKHHCL